MKPSPKALALTALLGCRDDGNTALDTDADTEPNTTDASSSGPLPTDPTPGTSSSGDPPDAELV